MNPKNFRNLIVRPTLFSLNLWSPSAEELLMLTAAQETHLGEYVRQGWKTLDDGLGVGRGPYSMEPTTHNDHWDWMNVRFPNLAKDILKVSVTKTLLRPSADEMVFNFAYATAMARVHYLRIPDDLPPASKIDLLAVYWDENYNRNPNAGFPSEAVANYKKYVLRQD